MELREYIDFLSALEEKRKAFESACAVFADITHNSLDGCEFWRLTAFKSTGQRMRGESAYIQEFLTAEDLLEHMELLKIGAMLAQGTEV